SNLAAYDFGYITAGEVIERCGHTLGSTEKLQRHRGHLYNWYDTRTLEPLRPLYVSTVDSGNFAAFLLTLALGLREIGGHKLCRPGVISGLAESLEVVFEEVEKRSGRD